MIKYYNLAFLARGENVFLWMNNPRDSRLQSSICNIHDANRACVNATMYSKICASSKRPFTRTTLNRLSISVIALMPSEIWAPVERHFAHTTFKRFSPVWMRSCDRRFELWLNDFLHTLHSKGFSPVWMHSCLRRIELWLNDFLHILHWEGGGGGGFTWPFRRMWARRRRDASEVEQSGNLHGWAQRSKTRADGQKMARWMEERDGQEKRWKTSWRPEAQSDREKK